MLADEGTGKKDVSAYFTLIYYEANIVIVLSAHFTSNWFTQYVFTLMSSGQQWMHLHLHGADILGMVQSFISFESLQLL